MWRLALDQNFNQDLFNAVEREYRKQHGQERGEPYVDLDVVTLLDAGLSEATDEVVLEWMAEQGRIVLRHDVKTMVPLANDRVREGQRMPGVILVRLTALYGLVVEDLCILLGVSTPEEWEGSIARLPY